MKKTFTMINKNIWIKINPGIFFMPLCFVWFIGCTKENQKEGYQKPDYLLEANFSKDFLSSNESAILFISDMQGALLADTFFTIPSAFKLYPKSPNVDIPDRIMVTLFIVSSYNQDSYVNILTYVNVQPANGYWPGNSFLQHSGNISLTFEKIPTNSVEQIVYSVLGYFEKASFVPQYVSLPLYSSNDNLYVKIKKKDNSVLVKWIPAVQAGTSYSIDYSSMDSPVSKSIVFPFPVNYVSMLLTGYLGKEDFAAGGYVLQWDTMNDTLADNITVFLPKAVFPNFKTSCYFHKSSVNNKHFYQYKTGKIPSEFNIVDADALFPDTSNDKFHIATSGNFQTLTLFWNYIPDTLSYYSWRFFCPNSQIHCVFPELPSSVRTLIPAFNSMLFSFNHADLGYYPSIHSYDDYINKTCRSQKSLEEEIDDYRVVSIYPGNSSLQKKEKATDHNFPFRSFNIQR